MALGRNFVIITIYVLLHSNLIYAASFSVTNNNASGAGSLSQAITDLNSTGTAGSSASANSISITAATGTITLGADLPVIQKGVTITSTNGTTVSGANSFRLFATFESSLALSNLNLTNGKAVGGSGINNSGGGLGAGGGVYIDLGQTLTLTNTSISGCNATGGPGGSGVFTGGGGGGASFSFGNKNATSLDGGGDFPGNGAGGGGASRGSTGYLCGGDGGSANGFSGGAGGGSNAGASATTNIGGAGGYCGGGGGSSDVSGVEFSAGGGNPGGDGGFGGGGGGYGSGAGFLNGAGGGGGFGGGGGGSGGAGGAGGGGGGFGGGGGGTTDVGPYFGGNGGTFAGNGAGGSAGGGGGGGAGIGGAIFAADSTIINIQNTTVNGTTITSNSATGGAAGSGATNGANNVGPDIFLFKGSQIQFTGSADLTAAFAMQADILTATALNGGLDSGVVINTQSSSNTITFTGVSNNYQGGTTITKGILSAGGSNLPSTGSISIGANSIFNVLDSYVKNSVPITNAGAINIASGASFAAPNTFTNTSGSVYVSGTGSLSGTISSGVSLNIGKTATGTVSANNLTIGTGSANSFTSVNIYNGSSLTTTGTGSVAGNLYVSGATSITGSNISGSKLTVGKDSLGTSNPSTNFTVSQTISTFPTIEIASGTLTLNPNGTISNFSSLQIDGTFAISSGASFTLSSSQNISGSGTGLISNSGQVIFDGSNINFSGSFFNNTSGAMVIQGIPTINLTGTTFTNQGNIITNFSTSNNLPLINLPNVTVPGNLDLSHGVIQIGYNNNYISTGQYTLLTAGTPPVLGVSVLPQDTYYFSNWSIETVGNNVVVQVTRNGFGAHALTPEAVAIGNWLEEIGSNNPTQSDLNLLNALETVENDSQLTSYLLTLLPPQYTMLVTLQSLDQILGALDVRLVSKRNGYSSGDNDGYDTVSTWLRAFSSTGTQQQHDTINGYSDKNRGYILGMDRTINNRLTLGAAASYSKTTVTDALQSNTITNINTYQFTFYSTLKSPKDIYVDALITGGVSNYHGARTILFPGYVLGASSNYSSQQLTMKVRASKNFNIMDFWQFTPDAMAQYSFVRQQSFTENGAGSYNIYTDPDNINLFRVGVGAMLGIPFTTNNMLSIPSVYTMAYVDAAGGADTINSQFISGGPVITNTSQSGRLMLKYGACYELKINDHLEFVANYDYIWRNGGFKGTEGLLNFRYTF